MKKHQIYLFIIVLLVFSALFACNTNSDKYDKDEEQRQLSELEKLMGAKFPPGSKIVYATSNERNKEAASQHIIYSPTPADFSRPPDGKIASETFFKILKKASVTKDLEKIQNKWTFYYSGTVGEGDWTASQTNYKNGSYLVVDQIFLHWQTN